LKLEAQVCVRKTAACIDSAIGSNHALHYLFFTQPSKQFLKHMFIFTPSFYRTRKAEL
jgi:hypothetical protein